MAALTASRRLDNIDFDDGGDIQAPIGRATIGAVITSTLPTLVAAPVPWSHFVRTARPASAEKPIAAAGNGAGAGGSTGAPASRH